MGCSLFLSFVEGVRLTPTEDKLTVQRSDRQVTLKLLRTAVRDALQRLTNGGIEEDRLEEVVLAAEGTDVLGLLNFFLAQLDHRALVQRSAADEYGRLATLAPISPHFAYPGRSTAPERSYALSRFAYLHREGDELWQESPLAHARLVLHDGRAAALIHSFSRPCLAADAPGEIPGLAWDAAAVVMDLMLNANLLGKVDESGMPATDRLAALQSWEFHDLLFHARSREGRHDRPVGGTYRFVGQLDPLPAVKPVPDGERVDLFVPDLAQLQREDPPFVRVQEQRRSLREYGEQPITAEQLAEFLYRVARVKERVEAEVETPAGPVRMEFALRPYPAAGALYEIESYGVVNVCGGVASGLYYYDPGHHRLICRAEQTAAVEQLLRDASVASGILAERLQVLLILAARFQRLSWKYASMAYAAILTNVGVLYQTMYLAATAMGLAPCALGCGDSDTFARAAGTDYFAETSVGEFLLGSRRDSL
jgi:SagB-type dehydrogenase family enzyme